MVYGNHVTTRMGLYDMTLSFFCDSPLHSTPTKLPLRLQSQKDMISQADSRFVPRQWETVLLCNNFSHWLGASLESALYHDTQTFYALMTLCHGNPPVMQKCTCVTLKAKTWKSKYQEKCLFLTFFSDHSRNILFHAHIILCWLCTWMLLTWEINTLMPRQDGCLFSNRHFQTHFLQWKCFHFD